MGWHKKPEDQFLPVLYFHCGKGTSLGFHLEYPQWIKSSSLVLIFPFFLYIAKELCTFLYKTTRLIFSEGFTMKKSQVFCFSLEKTGKGGCWTAGLSFGCHRGSLWLPSGHGLIIDIPCWIAAIGNTSIVLAHPPVKWNSGKDRRVHWMRGCDQHKGLKEISKIQSSGSCWGWTTFY